MAVYRKEMAVTLWLCIGDIHLQPCIRHTKCALERLLIDQDGMFSMALHTVLVIRPALI
jgi:hypothetical protein